MGHRGPTPCRPAAYHPRPGRRCQAPGSHEGRGAHAFGAAPAVRATRTARPRVPWRAAGRGPSLLAGAGQIVIISLTWQDGEAAGNVPRVSNAGETPFFTGRRMKMTAFATKTPVGKHKETGRQDFVVAD